MPELEPVGGVSGEPTFDRIVPEHGGYSVYSEGQPRKKLGGPYQSHAQAVTRLQQVEHFKHAHDTRLIRAAPPNPNTRPTPTSGRTIDRRDARRKKRPRLPLQIPPTRLGEDYGRGLTRLVRRVRAAYAPVLRALPDLIAQAQTARGDAAETDKLRALLEQAKLEAAKAISQPQLEQLSRKLADQTARYQKEQLGRQVRAALGADPVFRDRGMAARADQWVHESTSLIERIPSELHGRVATMVTRAVSSGQRGSDRGSEDGTLTRNITDAFDVSERHARVIARDQIGKFYARVNHARQKELGVTRFIWRTAGDERVTGAPGGPYEKDEPSHYDLDGEEYSYDDPPEAGRDGEPSLPGEPIQCRCWAEPIFDDDDDSDEGDDEGDEGEEGPNEGEEGPNEGEEE